MRTYLLILLHVDWISGSCLIAVHNVGNRAASLVKYKKITNNGIW
jgi:hypothetical protein